MCCVANGTKPVIDPGGLTPTSIVHERLDFVMNVGVDVDGEAGFVVGGVLVGDGVDGGGGAVTLVVGFVVGVGVDGRAGGAEVGVGGALAEVAGTVINREPVVGWLPESGVGLRGLDLGLWESRAGLKKN